MQKLSATLNLIVLTTVFFLSCTTTNDNHNISRADLVDMYMGVQGFSNCVIGPQLPHGSVNPSPHTPNGHHDGYHPDEPIRGFAQLHASGTGWGRYGQIFLSPQIGFDATEEGHDSPKSNETATPYYYAVTLNRYNIHAEVAPTHHCAKYKFTFPETDNANILLDVIHNIPQHIVPFVGGYFIKGDIYYQSESNLFTGWGEYAGGFGSADPYKVYFALNLDINPVDVQITNNDTLALYAQIKLPSNPGTVQMNVGISMKSIANAQNYLTEEVANHTFDDIKSQAKDIWNDTFSKIAIKGGTKDEQRLFYTAMYHSYVMPRDRTGDNPNWDSQLPHLDDHYCVWDTWRTKYPLMMLINESYVANTINSFIDRYAHDGECTPTYTSSLEWDWKQGGDDVDNVIADAFVKNLKGFDREKAYELMKWNAYNARNEDYRKYNGWVPETGERMSCSYTMEFAYNDFCAATVARIMKDERVADSLFFRSMRWVNLFNPNLESHGFKGFIGPRKANEEWITIDPAQRFGPWVEYFYEGNSWVYTLFTPHQFDKLIDLCGGKDEMIKRLTYGFENDLIELDNEPGFLSPFIFINCGRPDLAAKYVDRIRKNHFSLSTGYPENEDSGAMGAWYIFTSIGFFPNAGQDYYYLLPPTFPEVVMTMENGKQINIRVEKESADARYIKSVSLNGNTLNRPWIKHSELVQGAELVYHLTSKEN